MIKGADNRKNVSVREFNFIFLSFAFSHRILSNLKSSGMKKILQVIRSGAENNTELLTTHIQYNTIQGGL